MGEGNTEGRLCGHLAAALANFFLEYYNEGRKRFDSIVDLGVPNVDMTDFGQVQEALGSVRILVLKPGEDGNSHWLFALPTDEMPAFLATELSTGDPRSKTIIRAFVQIACSYAPTLPWWWADRPPEFTNAWFEAPALYRDAMEGFHRTGYTNKNGELFQWTEKIAFAMQRLDSE